MKHQELKKTMGYIKLKFNHLSKKAISPEIRNMTSKGNNNPAYLIIIKKLFHQNLEAV